LYDFIILLPKPLKITFLGTGTSTGIPFIGCDCEVCTSLDFRDKRLRTSIHIEIEGKSFVIDTTPDFRQQMLRERIRHITAILFTHQHKDHTAGLDDIRAFNFIQQQDIPIYGQQGVIEQIKQEFAYIFSENKYPGVPNVIPHYIENQGFEINNIHFTPIEVLHHQLPVFGFRIHDFTYITDANFIAKQEIEKIKGSKIMVINALQKTGHVSHFSLAEALAVIEEIKPEKAYLTHLSHRMGKHAEVSKELPDNVKIAYDGLQINFNENKIF
jgi:phosphoribosyl 1,2-cyclic phosphate phosphodiesterase